MLPKKEIRRVAVYTRVSTGSQNAAMQLTDIKRLPEIARRLEMPYSSVYRLARADR